MAIIQSGANSTSLMSVDPTFAAAHMSLRPPEQTGSYQIAALSGAVAGVGAGSPVFSMRWAPGTGALCLINSVVISAAVTTGFTTQQELEFGLFAARGFTVADTAGTQQVVSGNNQKMRTNMNTSLIASGGDMRISSTVALTAGTRTLDSQPMNANSFFAIAGTASSAITNVNIPLFDRQPGEYPIVLANNEGIVINNILAMGAAGVLRLVVYVNWTEVATYGV